MAPSETNNGAAVRPQAGGGIQALVLRLTPEWITPNLLTVLRIFGSVAIMGLTFTSTGLGWLIVIGLISGLSDNWDGMLARGRGQVTKLGAFLDPLADKLYAAALMLLLWWRGLFDWRILVLALAVDIHAVVLPFFILCGRLRRGEKLWPAPAVQTNRWGKLKTATLAWGMGFIVIGAWADWGYLVWVGRVGIMTSVGLGLVALCLYFRAWWRGDFA
ncbi:MAG: CDP-alcohol phosphatidyltransferase family protein [Pseudomonadota bacterium]